MADYSDMLKQVVFCLAITYASTLNAQMGLWPESDATWKVHHTEPHGLLVWVTPNQLNIINGFLYTEINYTLGSDTVIGAQTYSAVERSWVSLFESLPGASIDTMVNYPPQSGGFIGGFRALNDQVFFWDVADQTEHLLYDFDLHVGDTLPQSYIDQSHTAIIWQIDTLQIAGQAHRRFHLQGTGLSGTVLVDGIGSNHGPIQSIGIGFDINNSLLCYGRDGLTHYPDTGMACGPPWTGPMAHMNSTEQSDGTLVFPNPMRNFAWVQLPFHTSELEAFWVMDVKGKIARRSDQMKTFTNSIYLERNGLPAGLYLLQWIMKSGASGGVRVVIE